MDKLLARMGMSDTKYELKSNNSQSPNQSPKKQPSSQTSKLVKSATGISQKSYIQLQFINQTQQTKGFVHSNSHLSQQKQLEKIKSQRRLKNSSNDGSSKGNLQRKKVQANFQRQNESKNSFSNKASENKIYKLIEENQSQKLEQIVQYLRVKLASKCLHPNHERNKVIYLCFERNCENKVGCSYCFMQTHQNHQKSLINDYINHLEEAIFKINANNQLIAKKAKCIYDQFCQKLNSQIQNIKDEFETNLSFLKMKIMAQFEKNFRQKYLLSSNPKNPKVSEFSLQNNSNLASYSKIELITTKELPNGKAQNTSRQKFKDPIKQKEILSNLLDFWPDQIYLFLRMRLQSLHFQSKQSNIFLDYFEKINSSVTQMFSAFKRNIPKTYQQKTKIQKPNIMNPPKDQFA